MKSATNSVFDSNIRHNEYIFIKCVSGECNIKTRVEIISVLVTNVIEMNFCISGWKNLAENIYMYTREPIRKGTEVYLGYQKHANKNEQDLAIKLVHKTEKHEQEIDILLKLESHPYVIRIVTSGICDDTVPRIYLVMELCLQNLHEYVQSSQFDLQKAVTFFLQMAMAILHIHQCSIMHRDLKPSNVLISKDKKSIKVSDFGISKEIPGNATKATVTQSSAGTDGYRAPETYQQVEKLGYRADIYPMGIIAYFIVTHGRHPFGSNSYSWAMNIMENKNRDLSEIPNFPEGTSKKVELINLLDRMLDHDPEKRPTAQEIRADVFFDGKYRPF